MSPIFQFCLTALRRGAGVPNGWQLLCSVLNNCVSSELKVDYFDIKKKTEIDDTTQQTSRS
jgi:hypothetical protein